MSPGYHHLVKLTPSHPYMAIHQRIGSPQGQVVARRSKALVIFKDLISIFCIMNEIPPPGIRRQSIESKMTTLYDDDDSPTPAEEEPDDSRAASKLTMTNAAVNSIERFDVDELIRLLLDRRNKEKPPLLPQSLVVGACAAVRPIFLEQPMLLELGVPVTVLGDIHGQYMDLLRHFDTNGYPPKTNYLFLGDYVDRGLMSTECICLLFCYKIKYPENFFLLRGNHESSTVNRMYGFFEECRKRYTFKLWKLFNDVFNCMPIAAVIEDAIFCAHGGISPDIKSMDQIRRIGKRRPLDIPKDGILCDMVWSDPDADIRGWGENDRGISFTYGVDAIRNFLTKHGLSLIVRAHQVVEDGYQFFADRQLVTIFSAPNYCGEFDNAAAAMCIDENLTCSFKIVPPKKKVPIEEEPKKERKFPFFK